MANLFNDYLKNKNKRSTSGTGSASSTSRNTGSNPGSRQDVDYKNSVNYKMHEEKAAIYKAGARKRAYAKKKAEKEGRTWYPVYQKAGEGTQSLNKRVSYQDMMNDYLEARRNSNAPQPIVTGSVKHSGAATVNNQTESVKRNHTLTRTPLTVSSGMVKSVGESADNNVANITRSYALAGSNAANRELKNLGDLKKQEYETSLKTDNYAANRIAEENRKLSARTSAAAAGTMAAESYMNQLSANREAKDKREAAGITPTSLSEEARNNLNAYIASGRNSGTKLVDSSKTIGARELVADQYENAREYEAMKNLINPRKSDPSRSKIENAALNTIHGALGIPAAVGVEVGTSMASGMEGLANNVKGFVTREKPTDNDLYGASQAAGFREGILRGVRDITGNEYDGARTAKENVTDFLTGVGLDMANSVARAHLLGGVGGSIQASGSAANDSYLDTVHDDSVTAGQANALAAVNAFNEGFFERFSIENYLKMSPANSLKAFRNNLLKTMAVEGEEEGATEIGNIIGEMLILRDNSQYMQEYKDRIASGEDSREALMNTVVSAAGRVGQATLGGALSGVGSTGTRQLTGTIANSMDFNDTWRNESNPYTEIANSIDTSTASGVDARNVANEYAARVAAGGNVSTLERGVLQNAIENAAFESERAEAHEGIAGNESLDEKTRAEAENYAEKVRNGEEFTEEENAFLRKVNTETKQEETEETAASEENEEKLGYGKKPEGISDELWNEIAAEPYNMLSNEERTEKLEKKAAEIGITSKIQEMERKALDSWSKEYGASGQQAFKENFQAGMRTTDYVRAFNKIYDAGRYGIPIKDIDSSYAALISNEGTFSKIYQAGDADHRAIYDEATKYSYKDRQEARIGGVMDAYRTVPENVKAAFESLGKKTGIQFVLTDSRYDGGVGENALGAYKGDGIIAIDINPNQDGYNLMQTVSHEMTHWIQEYAPFEYQMFKEQALQAIMKSKNTTLDEEITKRRAAGYEGSREEITDEIVADSTGTFLNDADFAREISEKQPTVASRIVDWLKSVVDTLKELVSGSNIRKAAAALKEDLKRYESARDIWTMAVDEASEKMKTSEYTGTVETRNQAMLHEDAVNQKNFENNIKKVQKMEPVTCEITDDVYKYISLKNRQSKKAFLADKFKMFGEMHQADVGTIFFNRDSRSDEVGHGVQSIERIAAIMNLPEIIKNSSPVYFDYAHKGKTWDTATLASKVAIDNKNYFTLATVKVSPERNTHRFVFTSTSNLELYAENKESGRFTSRSVPSLIHDGSAGITSALHNKDIFDILNNVNSVDKNRTDERNNDKDIRFQKILKENGVDAEENGDLVAVHNVELSKLDKMLDLSSIAMPSIAVTKADMGWNDFGPVSFVFRRNTIDPKTDRRNRVYGADAWTPTFSNISIENEINEDVRYRVRNIIKKDTEGKIPAYLMEEAIRFVDTRANSIAENQSFTSLIEAAMEDRSMQAAYIAAKGETLDEHQETVNEPTISKDKISLYEAMVKEFGSELDGASKMPVAKIIENYGSRIQKVCRENLLNTGINEELAEKQANALLSSKFGGPYAGWRAVSVFTGAEKFKETGVQYKERTVRDGNALNAEIQEKLDKKGFKSWLENLFSGIITGSGIRNNVDLYTPSGNQRSFAATHYSVTPENLVRAMIESRDGKSKAASAAPGIRGIISAGSSEYSSIDEIHKDEGRLQPKDTDSNIDELENRLQEVEKKISDQGTYKSIGTIEDAIIEAAGKKRVTAASIRKAFDYYGWIKYTENDVNEILDIIKEARKVPTDMFEAKPERTVGFNEVAYVLVPDGINENVMKKLEEKGLNIVAYDSEVSGDRTEKLKSLNGVRFQLGIDDRSVPGQVYGQSEKLDKASDDLSELIIRAKDVMPSNAKISRLTSNLIKEWNSTVDSTELRSQIEKLYTSMSLSPNARGKDYADAAAAIGAEILDHAVISDPEQEARWNSFKKTLRNTIVYVPTENIHDVEAEGFNTLRKRYFQKIQFTTNPEYMEHTGSEVYKELQQQYPDYFTQNANEMYDIDAVQEIMNVRDNGGPILESGTPDNAQDYNEHAYALGERILNTFFNEADDKTRTEYISTYHKAVLDLKATSSRELKNTKARLEASYNRQLSLLKKKYAANNLAVEDYIRAKDELDRKMEKANLDRAAVAERLRKHKEEYVKRQRKATDIKRMESSMRKIQKMIEQPTDRNHVPAPLAKGIQQLFSVIDLTTEFNGKQNLRRMEDYKRLQSMDFSNALGDFKNVVNAVMNNDGILTDPETGIDTRITLDPDFLSRLEMEEEYIEEMAKKNAEIPKVRKMSYEKVHELYQLIQTISHMLEYANHFTTLDRNITVEQFAAKTFGELGSQKKLKTYSDDAPARKFVQKMLREGMLDSPTFFNLIGGDGGSGDILYASLRNGLDKKTVAVNESMKFMERTMNELKITGSDIQKWAQNARPIRVKSTDINVPYVTDAQLMELYVLNKREQARKHIYGNKDNLEMTKVNGGIQFDKTSGPKGLQMNKTKAFRHLTEQDVENLTDLLSPQQKQLAERMQRFLATSVSSWGNETSMNLYGYEKFLEPSYWPIRSASEYRATKTSDIERGMTTLANMGFTKATVQKAQNPIVIGNIFDTFTNHIDKMSSYNAFLPALEDLQKWLNYQDGYQSMKAEITDTLSDNALEFLNNLILDLNGSRGRADGWGAFTNILMGKAKAVAVSWSPSVAIQQPFSIVRAAAEIDPKYITRALNPENLRKRKEAWETAQKYAPIVVWKQIGGPDISTGRTMKSAIFGSGNTIDKINELGTLGAEMGDRITWTTLWQAAEEEVKDKQKDLTVGSPEYYAAAKKIFDHVIDFTQVVDSPLHRTEMMKSKSDFAKIVTSFQSEPMKTYDMLYREIYKAKYGNIPMHEKAKKRIQKTAFIIIANIIVTNAAKSLMGALKDPDKDKKYGERWMDAFLDNLGFGGFMEALDPENKDSGKWKTAALDLLSSDLSPAAYVPYVGTLIDMLNGYDSNISSQTLSDLTTAAKELEATLKGTSKDGVIGTLYKMSPALHVFGISSKNIMRWSGAVIDEIIGDAGLSGAEYVRNRLMMKISNQNNMGAFVSEAMKEYAAGNKELGDKLMQDLVNAGIDEGKIESRLSEMIKQEPELEAAAESYVNGAKEDYENLRQQLITKGYSEEIIDKKLDSIIDDLAPAKAEDVATMIYEGNNQETIDAYVNYMRNIGKEDKDIRKNIKSAMTKKYKEEYKNGDRAKQREIENRLETLQILKENVYSVKDFYYGDTDRTTGRFVVDNSKGLKWSK